MITIKFEQFTKITNEKESKKESINIEEVYKKLKKIQDYHNEVISFMKKLAFKEEIKNYKENAEAQKNRIIKMQKLLFELENDVKQIDNEKEQEKIYSILKKMHTESDNVCSVLEYVYGNIN